MSRGPAPQPRLPWQPISRYIDGHIGETVYKVCGAWDSIAGRGSEMQVRRGVQDFCRIHDLNSATVWRWKTKGLTVDAADRAAGLLGLHPFDIWGPDYYAIQGVYEEDAAA